VLEEAKVQINKNKQIITHIERENPILLEKRQKEEALKLEEELQSQTEKEKKEKKDNFKQTLSDYKVLIIGVVGAL
jgi:septum formation inhibitor MinC